jgi:hypothetical protein
VEKLELNENGSPTINITDEAIVMDDLTISSGYVYSNQNYYAWV